MGGGVPLLTAFCLVVFSALASSFAFANPKTPSLRSPFASLFFEENRGQAPAYTQFLARWKGKTLSLSPQEIVVTGYTAKQATTPFRMRLLGSAANAQGQGVERKVGVVNYLLGNDKANWRTHLPTYGKVRYTSVYSGIDTVYYGNGEQPECDFVVAPRADYRQIRLGFSNSDSVNIARDGSLRLKAGRETMTLGKPVIYQMRNGKREAISGGYVVRSRREIGFRVGAYNRSLPLVIDPVLIYSTTLGITDSPYFVQSIAVDSQGNTYVTGKTYATNFPTTIGAFQKTNPNKKWETAFVAKLSADGHSLIYGTYLNGTNGLTYGISITADSAGCAYIGGITSCTDFPITAGAFQTKGSSIVTKLSADGGSLIYSTYLGPAGLTGIAIDSAGCAYVAGATTSANFPVSANAFQKQLKGKLCGIVAKLNANGSALLYSTYLGGNDPKNLYGTDIVAIAVDGAGSAYVTGNTSSPDFPVTSGAFQTTLKGKHDAFVTKLSENGGGLIYSTYLGGTGIGHESGSADVPSAIALDSAGNAYVTGVTYSADFPVTKGAFQTQLHGLYDAFVTKLSANGAKLIYSTFLGGVERSASGDEATRGIAVDGAGYAYVTGYTTAPDFPTTAGSFQAQKMNSITDPTCFLTKLSVDGTALAYSTYFVLPGTLHTSVGIALALDAAGSTYVGESGWIPTTQNAFAQYGSGIITKFDLNLQPESLVTVGIPYVQEGGTIGLTATLTYPADTDVTLKLAAKGNVPTTLNLNTLTIPKGAISGTFKATFGAVTDDTDTTITVSLNNVSATAPLTVFKARKITATKGVGALYGGNSIDLTVTIDRAAGVDQTIALKLSNTVATISPTLVIPATKTSAVITATTTAVTADKSVTFTATLNGASKTRDFWVLQPRVLTSMTIPSGDILANKTYTGTMTITPAAKLLNVGVSMKSTQNTVLKVTPASLVFADGVGSMTFTLTTGAVTKDTKVTLSATWNGKTLSQDIIVKK